MFPPARPGKPFQSIRGTPIRESHRDNPPRGHTDLPRLSRVSGCTSALALEGSNGRLCSQRRRPGSSAGCSTRRSRRATTKGPVVRTGPSPFADERTAPPVAWALAARPAHAQTCHLPHTRAVGTRHHLHRCGCAERPQRPARSSPCVRPSGTTPGRHRPAPPTCPPGATTTGLPSNAHSSGSVEVGGFDDDGPRSSAPARSCSSSSAELDTTSLSSTSGLSAPEGPHAQPGVGHRAASISRPSIALPEPALAFAGHRARSRVSATTRRRRRAPSSSSGLRDPPAPHPFEQVRPRRPRRSSSIFPARARPTL